jgi:hypothetical protein
MFLTASAQKPWGPGWIQTSGSVTTLMLFCWAQTFSQDSKRGFQFR